MIPNEIKAIMLALNSSGYECYLVGGCVRDTIMGKTPHDYDLTTAALPEQMQAVFADCRVIETGLKHGTITVLTDIGGVEITTYRIDGEYKDSRRPESVSFTPNLSEDLARRDFTVNAMAMSSDGEIVDIYNGKNDIDNCIIRCVGAPEKRFNEDALRILRALRFASVLDFDIAPSTADAIHSMYTLLDKISAERIREELFKLLCGKASKGIMLDFAEVMFHLIPELDRAKYNSALNYMALAPEDPIIRLAVLISVASSSPSTDIITVTKRLKCSRYQVTEGLDYAKIITLEGNLSLTDIAHLADQMGLERLNSAIITAVVCDNPSALIMQSRLAMLIDNDACLSRSQLAIDGTLLASIGLPKGKAIGAMLDRLFSAVAEGECLNRTELLLKFAKDLIK